MNLIERLAGRQYALDMLQSVDGMPKAMFADGGGLLTVARNLEQTARQRPGEYSEGVLLVVLPLLEMPK